MKYTDEDLLNSIKDFVKINNYIPNATDWDKANGPSRILYNKRFGGWKNALSLAGFDIKKSCLTYGKNTANFIDNDYIKFKNKCLERDNNTCILCDSKDYIQVHHLLKRSEYPEYKLLIDNGVTLCYSCHINIHNGTLDKCKKQTILLKTKELITNITSQ